MDRITLASEWSEYRAAAVHPEAPPSQIAETKKAFYAGAIVALKIGNMIFKEAIASGDIKQFGDKMHEVLTEAGDYVAKLLKEHGDGQC